MKLSIVTTLYQSSAFIREFYERINRIAQKITGVYEIIFVNDGSPDDSLEIAVSLHKEDTRVKVVDLSRNFGHHKAMMAGLSYSKGDYIFLIDCDLEEEPELLEKFFQHFNAHDDVDVVYGVVNRRKGKFWKRIFSALYYKIFNFLSDSPIPQNLVTVRLMSKRYVKNLLRHRESQMIIAGLWAITGFNQVPLVIDKKYKGTSSYTLRKRLSLAVNSITSFSAKPLVYISLVGILVLVLSIIYILYLISLNLFFGRPLPGYTSILVSIWFLGGLITFSIGIVGVYLSKVFTEVKKRPYVIVKDVYKKEERN